MTEISTGTAAVSPGKRTHLQFSDLQSTASCATSPKNAPVHAVRHSSPAPSTSSSLTDLTSVDMIGLDASSSTPATKKRKLNFVEREAEKAAKRREKEEKERQRVEEKARKEEEKRSKDEERQRIAEEKENMKRVKEIEKAEKLKEKQEKEDAKQKEKQEKEAQKEAEKQKKETEKAQKEAEKLKRERSQMRLGSFFGKPALEPSPPSTPEAASQGTRSRQSSIAGDDTINPSTKAAVSQSSSTDFNKWFLPYFVPDHTEVAPQNRFKVEKESDFDFVQSDLPQPVKAKFQRPRKRQKTAVSVKTLLSSSINDENFDIDLDTNTQTVLRTISYKILKFKEDVRPPYQGTFTRNVPLRSSKRLSRNPFTRTLPSINYDYDSEAEWEPPAEDDEDLEGEDAMSDVEDDEEEMADFLDDENDAGRKRGPLIDMKPVSSGLCWAGSGFDDNGFAIDQYRLDFLHDSQTFPIDPFSTDHWTDEGNPKLVPSKSDTTAVMQPPRLPLSNLIQNKIPVVRKDRTLDGKPLPLASPAKPVTAKQLRLIEPEFIAEFKRAIDGSDLTKTGLIEILKKQFPKCSKDAIKDTIGAVAVRVGKKEAEKKWQLIDTS